MAVVRIIGRPDFEVLDLSQENFSSWAWAESGGQNDNGEAVSGLSYEELKEFLCELKKKRKFEKSGSSSNESEDGIGGLFRIRWRPEVLSPSRTGVIAVAYGFNASRANQLSVTSYSSDILYIGKARDVWARVARIFSAQESSNSVARKIVALTAKATEEARKQQRGNNCIDNKLTPKGVSALVIFDFVQEEHPVKRDFMKAYAVSNEKPCLNIGLEH